MKKVIIATATSGIGNSEVRIPLIECKDIARDKTQWYLGDVYS